MDESITKDAADYDGGRGAGMDGPDEPRHMCGEWER